MNRKERGREKERERERERERGLEGYTNTHKSFCCVFRRYLQSQAEVRKLHVVKEELDRLDFLVTRDVGILRNKIEEANREYNLARYAVAQSDLLLTCSLITVQPGRDLSKPSGSTLSQRFICTERPS